MRLRIRVSLSLLFLTLAGAWAQTADDFFHGGAQNYLSNNVPGALEVVTNGLQRFPDDVKLKKLYELLNQQQQQQQQQQQKQNEQQKDQPQDQKQDQHKQDEQKQQDQEQSKNDQQKKDEPQKQEQQESPGDKSKDKPDQKKESGEPQQAAPHAMTPQEAQRLLDAQKGEEQFLQFKPAERADRRERPLKDW